MDGHFVPNLALGLDAVRAIRNATRLPVAIHAAVEEPERFVEMASTAGADSYTFHIEACRFPYRMAELVRSCGMEVGVAFSPSTPLEALAWLPAVDQITVLTVEPGFAGGPWIPTSPARVRQVRRACPVGRIIVDGHIDIETAPVLWSAGATDFVCGSSALFFEGSDYATSLGAIWDALAVVPGVVETW